MKKTILLALVLILVFITTGCATQTGVSQEDYDDLQAKYEALTTENSQLEEQLESANIVEQSTDSTSTESDSVVSTDNQEADQMIEDLSILSAFMIWKDYYYQNGIIDQTDAEFNERLGTLISGIDNTNLQAAYYAYYKAEVAYQQVVATLPQDDSVWTKTQYDNWVEAGNKRSTALGQVGGYLNPLVESIEWFNQ